MTTQHKEPTAQQGHFVEELLSQLQGQQQLVEEFDRQETEIRQKWDEELRELSEKRERARMVIRHLQALLALHGHPQAAVQPSLETTQGKAESGGLAHLVEAASLADLAYQLILQTGKEYHYRDLATALIQSGVNIPGSNAANSLVARIHDDPRLIRPRRGVYALKEWYPGAQSVGKRKQKTTKKRTRRKGRGSASTGNN